MSKKIASSEVADTIKLYLATATDKYTEAMKDTVEKVADGVMDETKSHITWKDKEYSKNFRLTTTKEAKRKKYKTWCVEPPYYRLTHLLEFGHHTRKKKHGKEYTDKFPHVKYGAEFVQNNFERELKEAIESAKF